MQHHISFTAVCTIPVIDGVELRMDENKEGVGNCDDSTIPVIGGVELGMDENKEGVGNGDDSFSAERKNKKQKSKWLMINTHLTPRVEPKDNSQP